MRQYVVRWRAHDRVVRRLLRTTELWFVPGREPGRLPVHVRPRAAVAEEPARQRRRRPDHASTDGVDPNRNFPNHWGYDNEGSSSLPSSETYRGPSPASEPETRALKGLLDRIGFAFQVNYHSNGQWLLYADGWQIGTPTADDPIYYALSGNLDKPAIEDFHPGLSSTSSTSPTVRRPATPSGHRRAGLDPGAVRGLRGLRLRLPRRPGRWSRRSSSGTCRSRGPSPDRRPTPTTRSRSLGIKTKPLLPESDDPYKRGIPGAHLTFDVLLRRPAAGGRPGQAQPRGGHGEVPHQRRAHAVRADLGVGRRRAVRPAPPSTTTRSAAS